MPVAYFYMLFLLQSSASNSLSLLDENMYSFLRLSQYIHLSHVNNGVVVVGPRVLLTVDDSTVYRTPGFYP